MKNIVLSIFAIFTFAGCLSEPESLNISNIDKEVNIYLSQQPTENGPEISFRLQSVDQFDCQDGTIESIVDVTGDDIFLRINNIDIPETCMSGVFPAYGNASQKLDKGQYNFTIELFELIQEEGTLTIDEEFFKLNVEGAEGINILTNKIKILPANHIWGNISHPNQPADLEEFLNHIILHLNTSTEIVEEDYGLFVVNDLSEIGTIKNSNEVFMFHEVADLDSLKNVIEEYRTKFPGLIIDLTYSTGEVL